MSPKTADDRAAATGVGYFPKKYWWVILIVVPLVVALIQYQPWNSSGGGASGGISNNQFNGAAIIGDVSVVINEAAKTGTTLDEGLIKLIKEAAALGDSGQHAEAVAAIEKVRSSSPQVAALPTLLNGLGAEQLAAGNETAARKTFEDVIAKDPTNRLALEGLRRLPADRIKGVKLVNFSSESYGFAAYIVDENPNLGWRSAAVGFPHSFVLELPSMTDVSELSFNNVASVPSEAAKDVEVSVSTDSANAGFNVVTKVVLTQGEIGQGFSLKPAARARWIKLRILSNYGGETNTQMGDVQVIGRPSSR